MLEGIDILVFDIQDIGARFYTYISTMAYAMEEAGKAGIRFLVLDRPNPVTGKFVEGPVLDSSHLSFTGYFPLPVRHGMTVGELAQLFNGENHLNVGLEVVKVEGWQRDQWFDDTGIPWVNPSPNIRCLRQAVLYTAAGLVESTNVSVGRGTESPFEMVGAPWVSAPRLTSLLKKRKLPGVSFTPAHFTPTSDRYRGQLCHGVQLNLTDRSQFRSVECGLEIARALALLYPRRFNTDKLVNMIGSEAVTRGIRQGTPVQQLLRLDRPKLSSFLKTREKYLIYK